MRSYLGNTLIELIIFIVLMASLACMAVPSFTHTRDTLTGQIALNEIASLCRMAQTAALNFDSNVTICPSEDHKTCSSNWQHPLIAFVKLNHDPLILYTLPAIKHGSLSLQVFPKGNKLIFNHHGTLTSSNATLQFCPSNNNAHNAKALIINSMGRIRFSKDANQNGIDEDAQGQDLNCPA